MPSTSTCHLISKPSFYLKADASAAGPKRFPNHSIQWIGSITFFKCFGGCLFVIDVHLALQYYLLKPSLRGRFVIYMFKLLNLRVVSTRTCCAGAEKGEVAEVKLRPSVVTGILKNE